MIKPNTKPSALNLAAIPSVLQELLTTTADQLAKEHGVIQRQRVLTGSSLAQALVFGWLEKPEARLTDLAQTSGLVGTPVSPQALGKRLEQKEVCKFLRSLFEQASSHLFGSKRELPRGVICFEEIEICDGSIINLPQELQEEYPGCGKPGEANYAGIKLLTKINWVTGTIQTELLSGKDHDRITGEGGEKQTLYLRDMGFFNLKALKAEDQAGHKFISRVKSGVRIYHSETQEEICDLGPWLNQQASSTGEVDVSIELGKKQRIACRLVARRVPPEVWQTRVKNAHLEAAKRMKPKNHFVSQDLEWDIRVTNVGAEILTVDDVFLLYCLRWQIELLFKLLKSEHLVDQARSQNPQHYLSAVLAKLLGALITHWCVLLTAWQELDSSLVLLSRAVRRCVGFMIAFLRGEIRFEYFKEVLNNAMSTGVSLQRRRSKPNSVQKLEAIRGLS